MYTNKFVECLFLVAILYWWGQNSPAETNTNSSVGITSERPPVEFPAMRIERAVFLVKQDKGLGSGFLMQEDDQVFFTSNMHVLSGGTDFLINNIYGETISVPNVVQVASDRDLMRFSVDYPSGLRIAKDYKFGDKVCAVGNSGGVGVITRLDGTIMALGPKLVEISCTIIPGNSGGPVLDESNRVVCVSTFLTNNKNTPDWILKGSRFTETRRMASRMDNVKWITMSWKDFCREAAYVNQMEDYTDEIVGIVAELSDKSLNTIYSETPYEGIQTWIKSYNQYARSYGSRLEKVNSGTTVSYKLSSGMKNSYRAKLRELSVLMDDLSREIDLKAVSIPYFKEQLEKYQFYFEGSRQHMETVVETIL
jgi:hypothetical protein